LKKPVVTLHSALTAAIFLSWGLISSVSAADSSYLPQSAKRYGANLSPGQFEAKVGTPSPNFTLDAVVSSARGNEFKKVSLTDFRGKWVVLFFYPGDFTFVCPTEIKGFGDALGEFTKLNTVVLGASVDSKYSHLAWIQRGDLGTLKFPLLSDITKDVTYRYGILDETEGVAYRGLFIIDPEGILQYMLVHNMAVGRNVDEVLRVLGALQTGELCPLGWKPGEKTLGK
jgi:peroxiredoxin 2/4